MDPVDIIKKLLNLLDQRCPVLTPSIFSNHFRPMTAEDICDDKAMSQTIKKLAGTSDHLPNISFQSKVDLEHGQISIESIEATDDIDSSLHSVETILNMMIKSSPEELNVYIQRFLDLNRHDVEVHEGKRIFYEVYHLAYAIQVALSNLPALPVTFRGHSVPISSDFDVQKFSKVDKSTKAAVVNSKKKRKEIPQPYSSADNNDLEAPAAGDSDSENEFDTAPSKLVKKQKKRSRGQGKKAKL